MDKTSLKRLSTCHPDLIRLFEQVDKTFPLLIIEGHRGREAQHAAFAAGRSKLDWPKGKHNSLPSLAVDAAPLPLDWAGKKSREKFYLFAGFVLAQALALGISLRWGGDWDSDWDIKENSFDDLVHFELRL